MNARAANTLIVPPLVEPRNLGDARFDTELVQIGRRTGNARTPNLTAARGFPDLNTLPNLTSPAAADPAPVIHEASESWGKAGLNEF